MLLKPRVSQKQIEAHVTYTPSLPSLTIRTIISTIKLTDEALEVSLAQDVTIEDRAEALSRREQKALLKRLLVAFIFSIPTFIIGIVFMSLLPSDSAVRQYFERSLWLINVPRSTWILFFFATIVWLFAADIFHKKALTELISLWRPGSRSPIWQRFIKFGSMNLLVSLCFLVCHF